MPSVQFKFRVRHMFFTALAQGIYRFVCKSLFNHVLLHGQLLAANIPLLKYASRCLSLPRISRPLPKVADAVIARVLMW